MAFRVDGAAGTPEPYKPNDTGESSGNEQKEINIFTHEQALENTVNYVKAHDGGANSTEYDGKDKMGMINMLKAKFSEFESKLPETVKDIIKNDIEMIQSWINDEKKQSDMKYLASLTKLVQPGSEAKLATKIKQIRKPETAKYYIGLLNEMYNTNWELAQYNTGADSTRYFRKAQDISQLRAKVICQYDILTGVRDKNGQIVDPVYYDPTEYDSF